MSVLSTSFACVMVLVAMLTLLFPSLLPSAPASPPLLEAAYRGDLPRVMELLALHRNRSAAAVDDIRDRWNNSATHVSSLLRTPRHSPRHNPAHSCSAHLTILSPVCVLLCSGR